MVKPLSLGVWLSLLPLSPELEVGEADQRRLRTPQVKEFCGGGLFGS